MFNELEVENNRKGNELRDNGKMLELKEMFHRKLSDRFIVHEGGFIRDIWALIKGKKWSGKAINDKALDAIANYKHALCLYNEYSSGSTDNP